MDLVVCSTVHEKQIFDYIFQKRPNWATAQFRKVWTVVDDRSGIVEVIDNRNGKGEYHKFDFSQYMMYYEKLIMSAAQELYPQGESDVK